MSISTLGEVLSLEQFNEIVSASTPAIFWITPKLDTPAVPFDHNVMWLLDLLHDESPARKTTVYRATPDLIPPYGQNFLPPPPSEYPNSLFVAFMGGKQIYLLVDPTEEEFKEFVKDAKDAAGPSLRAHKPGVETLKDLTVAQFDALVHADQMSIFMFDAEWNGPGKMIAPHFRKASEQEEYCNVRFYRIDVDESPEVAEHQDISAMPTFMAFKKGQQLGRFKGAVPVKLQNLLYAAKTGNPAQEESGSSCVLM